MPCESLTLASEFDHEKLVGQRVAVPYNARSYDVTNPDWSEGWIEGRVTSVHAATPSLSEYAVMLFEYSSAHQVEAVMQGLVGKTLGVSTTHLWVMNQPIQEAECSL